MTAILVHQYSEVSAGLADSSKRFLVANSDGLWAEERVVRLEGNDIRSWDEAEVAGGGELHHQHIAVAVDDQSRQQVALAESHPVVRGVEKAPPQRERDSVASLSR